MMNKKNGNNKTHTEFQSAQRNKRMSDAIAELRYAMTWFDQAKFDAQQMARAGEPMEQCMQIYSDANSRVIAAARCLLVADEHYK